LEYETGQPLFARNQLVPFTKRIPPAKNLSSGEDIQLFHSFMFLFYKSWFEALDVALSE